MSLCGRVGGSAAATKVVLTAVTWTKTEWVSCGRQKW